jgi:hypothetical protein
VDDLPYFDLFLKPGAVLASELAAKRGCGAVIAPQPPSARLASLAGLSAGVARRDL